MSILEAIVLGIIQGLTEFLPLSSTAHLRIVPALMALVDGNHAWNDPGAAASAIIQLGTLGALIGYFRRDIISLTRATIKGLIQGKPFETEDSRLAWVCALGSVPIFVFGLAFQDVIVSQARSLWIITAALMGLALLLYWAEHVSTRLRSLPDVTWVDGLVIGLAQAAALIPGSSRSGTTITAGLFLGLNREAAARFSFLLSIPAVATSGLYELFEVRHELFSRPESGLSLIVAVVVSFVSGYGAIAFLLRYLRTHSTDVFVWYRLGLGIALTCLLLLGKIS